MSRTDRGFLGPALFGLVTICVSSGMLIQHSLENGQKQQQGATKQQARNDTRDASSASTFATYGDLKEPACYYAKNHDAADLCAQWRSAIAAEKAAIAAERTVDLSILGMLLTAASVGGLLFNIVQGQRGLKAAREANMIAVEAATIESRPVLVMKDIEVAFGALQTGQMCFVYENIGKTPAYLQDAAVSRDILRRRGHALRWEVDKHIQDLREIRIVLPGQLVRTGPALIYPDHPLHGKLSFSSNISYSSALTQSDGKRGRVYETVSSAVVRPLVSFKEGVSEVIAGDYDIENVVGYVAREINRASELT